ncbi:transglycosylase domain-containing protein [Kibdelosporangium philippinense]|uniref:transglycosylase domain-containing protein n=1 Tax=Kibdelosporangium philippinense TaxID=211113 RepID=UPI0027E05103|nr:transglycosylase domain-containing protein [Kibdelosporangium philippinense]
MVYFGRGANGIQAAAQAYFGKNVQQLDVSEAALLAGVIQRPTYWDPDVDRENAERRWNFVLDQMTKNGWLTNRASLKFPTTLPRNAAQSSARLQIENQVLAELEDLADLPRDALQQRGYRVITTIDQAAQTSLEQSVSSVMAGQPDYLRAAAVSLDPKSGGVLAYHGGGNGVGLDYAQSPQDAGTTFGTFVAVAALRQGFRPDHPLDGTSPRMIDGIPFQNPAGVRCSPCSLRASLGIQANTASAELASQVGVGAVAEAAHQLGIARELRGKPAFGADPDTRIAVGGGSTSVRTIDMAHAYATLAANGMRTTPHFVSRVEDIDGNTRYNATLPTLQAIPSRIAQTVIFGLERDQGAFVRPGVRAFGDGGANAKAWMVGYNFDIVTAVWMGADRIIAIKNKEGRDITPAGEPTTIWRAVMDGYRAAHAPKKPTLEPVPKELEYNDPKKPSPNPAARPTPRTTR